MTAADPAPAPESNGASTVQPIAAPDQNAPVQAKTYRRSRNFANLVAAMAAAQADFKPIERDKTAKIRTKTGGEYQYKYADLASVLAAVTPSLSKNGLALFTTVEVDKTYRFVTATPLLYHVSGEWIETEYIAAITDENRDPRVVGSAATYARRYGVCHLLGIATEDDDDGESAAGGGDPRESRKVDDHPNAPRGQATGAQPRDTRDARQTPPSQPPKQDPPKPPPNPPTKQPEPPLRSEPFPHDTGGEPDAFWTQLMNGLELTKNFSTKDWRDVDFFEWWDRELVACSDRKALTALATWMTEFRKAGNKSEYCKMAAAKMSAMYSARDAEMRQGRA